MKSTIQEVTQNYTKVPLIHDASYDFWDRSLAIQTKKAFNGFIDLER